MLLGANLSQFHCLLYEDILANFVGSCRLDFCSKSAHNLISVWTFGLLVRFFQYLFMETPAFFYAVFLWFLLLSVTGYSIYVGFGPPSKELRDPFEDHED